MKYLGRIDQKDLLENKSGLAEKSISKKKTGRNIHKKKNLYISVFAGFLIGLFCINIISYFVISPMRSKAANYRDKRVISVTVGEDDSLWSIANRYYTSECGSIKEYIQEIKSCNSLTEDTIYSGYPLIVPVWVTDEEAVALQQ